MIEQTHSCNLPLEKICGLRPQVWLSVGAGFAREDIKALVLSQGIGFTGDAITTLQDLCVRLSSQKSEIQSFSSDPSIPQDSARGILAENILSAISRQEILKMLLAEPRISAGLPEMRRIKRQRSFIRRLDLAMQVGRMAFAHPEEEEVYEERLLQSLGENPVRQELRALSRAYEAWMGASQCWDLPMMLHHCISLLREGWPQELKKPEEIWVLSTQNPESLEKEFWEAVGLHISVRFVTSLVDKSKAAAEVLSSLDGPDEISGQDLEPRSNGLPSIQWLKWHTLDDAAEYLADLICTETASVQNWKDYAVLIPDIPSTRRSLRRALESRGIPVADPRDPTRLRWDEILKWAILPLEVVGKNFERQKVISWLRAFEITSEFPIWTQEMSNRGIRNGIHSYASGKLTEVHERLVALEKALGGRKTCRELADAHILLLKRCLIQSAGTEAQSNAKTAWLIPFFEYHWEGFCGDIARIDQGEKRAPLLYWLERFQLRLNEASPPVEAIKPEEGLRIYRLQQAPVSGAQKIWIFGLPPQWLGGDGTGSYWFSERERELLAAEFAVRSCVQVHDERLSILGDWIQGAGETVFLDSHYSESGREQESLLPLIGELADFLKQDFPGEPEDRGAHHRFTKSYGAIRPFPSQTIELPPLPESSPGVAPILTASAIDRYSRCPFQALAFYRWKLKDIREPDTELWPDVRGNILHEAVRILLNLMDFDGHFEMLPREALELAWKKKRPLGLIQSERVVAYVKSRLCVTLETFCEKEREYTRRSGARAISLDEMTLRLDFPEFSVVGQPDRVDQQEDHLFIIDYKSSGTVPNGTDMIENGYRLQLPFYALAASQKLQKPVVGVQFVELDRKGSRNSGIFFKDFNGKEKGNLVQVRANSKSLISKDREDVWGELEEKLVEDGNSFVRGKFRAFPRTSKREKECSRCSVAELCGVRRLGLPEVTEVL